MSHIWRCLFCLAVRLGSSMAPCKLFGRPLSRPPQARNSRSLIWSAAVAASAGQGLMLPHYYTSVLSQQQTSVLSQQQTSVLSQQQTSVLSQQKTSILSQLVCSVGRTSFFRSPKLIWPASVGGNLAKRLQEPKSKRTPPCGLA